jgi:hypothetical protein
VLKEWGLPRSDLPGTCIVSIEKQSLLLPHIMVSHLSPHSAPDPVVSRPPSLRLIDFLARIRKPRLAMEVKNEAGGGAGWEESEDV